MDDTAKLRFEDVSLRYGRGDDALLALDKVDIEVGRGEPVSFIGPSGCGKSSMLLIAAGLLAPTRGAVRIDGKTMTRPRRESALILQDLGLFPWKTVYDNVAIGLRIRHIGARERDLRTRAALEQVELGSFSDVYPNTLSGGMRQRIALARAIALDSDLLLMDEPLSALDALLRENLQDTLLELWRERGHAQVLVTHSIEEAVFLGRRIVVFSPRPGRVAGEVSNPMMGESGYRSSPVFFERCGQVRALLQEGATEVARP